MLANNNSKNLLGEGSSGHERDITLDFEAGVHQIPVERATVTEVLDSFQETLVKGRTRDIHDIMERLVKALFQLRCALPPQAWEEVISVCRRHPICTTLHQDPLTRRSFDKPRGYSGDAPMIDMIYDTDALDIPSCSEVGQAVFSYTAGSGRSPHAVRYRRALIASLVDKISEGARSRVLSIAAGHLREAELSRAFRSGRITEWVAVDQDEDSVTEIGRRYGTSVIRPLKGSVRQLLSRKSGLRDFDFVYAAGLFDYLSAPVAAALISRMFEMLTPGGTALVANFSADFIDAGYMEAFMDWKLTYRREENMRGLLAVLDGGTTTNARVFTDSWNAIIYAAVERSREEDTMKLPSPWANDVAPVECVPSPRYPSSGCK